MKVVVVTGIWPPDSGGPASHASALADFLHRRGHGVAVVTTASGRPSPRPYRVDSVSRALPAPARHVRCAALVRARAARADVVYATSMIRRAALGAELARRPLVVKLVSDEVYERARREDRFVGTLDEFQRTGGIRFRLLRALRDQALRRAQHVFSPSAYLREIALSWGLDAGRVSVLPNPAPVVPPLPDREQLRTELGLDGPTLAFAGRLGVQKSLDVALDAVAAVPEVSLAIAGEGPERRSLERRTHELGLDGRVRFLGSLSRDDVLRLFRAADASLLASSWENYPHTVVEALAVGSPVLATAVGGVPEVVRDGENGLLVRPGDAEALAGAIRRFVGDPELRARLARGAQPSVAAHTEESIFSRIEKELERAVTR